MFAREKNISYVLQNANIGTTSSHTRTYVKCKPEEEGKILHLEKHNGSFKVFLCNYAL